MKKSLTAMLKQFNIPKNSDFIVYDEETRKVLFFRRTKDGYVLKMSRNRRGNTIQIRKNDIVFTKSVNGQCSLGAPDGVFERV